MNIIWKDNVLLLKTNIKPYDLSLKITFYVIWNIFTFLLFYVNFLAFE